MGQGFGKDGKGVIIHENRSQALSTLAPETAIFIGTKLAITDAFRMLKSEIYLHGTGFAVGEGDKLAMYLAHGDLTVAEIKNSLELDGPISRGDIESARRANRPIFLAGQLEADEVTTNSHLAAMEGGGHVAVIKPRWTFPDSGVGWNWVIWNFSENALTTGATVVIQNKAYGLWVGV